MLSQLKARIQANAKPAQAKVQSMKNSDAVVGSVTVEQVIGGMRGIKGMLTETSSLDPAEGIRYRGVALMDACKQLPKAKGGESALPEGAFWLLLTGDVPKAEEVQMMTDELHKRSTIPAHVMKTIDSLPKDMHPMTQLSIAILALQPASKFAQWYAKGTMKKADYWEATLDDCLTLVAQFPIIAAKIYRRTFKDDVLPASRKDLDWAGNFANMLGVTDDEQFKEAMRLYLTIHADHEGGAVSSATAHKVGSALSDPYYAVASGMCGLAGPLHGLANQECLNWLEATQKTLAGKEPTLEVITKFTKDTLASGQVIPGFGHAVLRKTDPRYTLEHEFCKKHLPNDPTFKLADMCLQAVPPVLIETGKAKNPWPNVDALSGTVLKYYGMTESDFYTVVFGASRSLGIAAQLVWARLLGLPIERPNSVTIAALEKVVGAAPPKAKL